MSQQQEHGAHDIEHGLRRVLERLDLRVPTVYARWGSVAMPAIGSKSVHVRARGQSGDLLSQFGDGHLRLDFRYLKMS